jgi:hypothetical protein
VILRLADGTEHVDDRGCRGGECDGGSLWPARCDCGGLVHRGVDGLRCCDTCGEDGLVVGEDC